MTPFSSDDLGRLCDARALTRGRSLVLLGAVEVRLAESAIAITVEHLGLRFEASLTASAPGGRVVLGGRCSCRVAGCAHLAAGGLAALDRFPALRRAVQRNFIDTLAAAPAPAERQRLVFELSPGAPPAACSVAVFLVGERTGRITASSPAAVLADRASSESSRIMARLLGGGAGQRSAVTPAAAASVLAMLARLGRARWHATGAVLRPGAERVFAAGAVPDLPARSAVIPGDGGPWYVDGATGELGRVRRRPALPKPPPTPRARLRRTQAAPVAEPVILDHAPVPVLRLVRVESPDDYGQLRPIDALSLEFDYAGVPTPFDDERQFVRVPGPGGDPRQPCFLRRDRAAEALALEALRPDQFSQMRLAAGPTARGRLVFVYRGRDAAERWQVFLAERLPALVALGWQSEIDRAAGPRAVELVGDFDLRVSDAEPGRFALDFGIEIDGTRAPLLPILTRLLERGGMAAAQVVEGELITSLDDGRILKLPAERIARLLAVMGDLIEAARRGPDDALVLPDAEAASLIELEELLTTRWQDAGAIAAYAERFRGAAESPPVAVPAAFRATLRPYQQLGVNWLQHLRAHGMGGFLADDMGLGKTAQTIAHLTIEHAQGRLDRPALIVVPTSLVANWSAELARFAPHLRVLVLHGLARHQRRAALDRAQVAITTYTVLARDIEAMRHCRWHIVVLDEAQVIKSPDAKATRAVCQLETRHRLCLSGTPIENNLQELWSEFAFLMPGLLGERKRFARRFRVPIEKNNDALRRAQLIRRIRPFLLRRTKAEVASDLPPRHTIIRRIDLAAEQRDLYETIRGTLYETVREQIAGLSAARGRIVVLDALLKLRQVCCDPRLVKLPSARQVAVSSKLDTLMEMLGEMLPEGRRVLLFSQFTSMLDLIKPRLDAASISYVELRGDTNDRAAPVRRFQQGEVPLFLISLKAGGRGLNLTAADTVIHYDPWWNPAAEDQASDRAHRIGQTRSVFVYKLIAAETVEDRIVALQQRKAQLAEIALGGDEDAAGQRGLGQGGLGQGELVLGEDELEFLFADAQVPRAA